VIPHRHRVRMRQGLEACSAISCRDSFALDLVRSVAPKLSREAVLVCDPTFNRHFRSEVVSRKEQDQIQRRLVSAGLDLNRNRVVLAMKPSERSVGIARGLVEKGYQVVGLTPGLIGVDVDASALGIGPRAWANVFRSFDFCVTERMHAAIFCAINNVPFFGLDINRVQGRKGTKFTELATALGVEGAVEDPSMVIGSSSYVDRMEALLKGPTWDWSLINAKIDRMSDGFLGFLGAALNKCAGGGAP